ncbi:MAG: response regulator transcription factor [Planctomycetota bacterium]
MGKTIRLLLIEDHPEYREVIKLALESEKDIDLVGQAGSSERALSILKRPSESLPLPDLILLDLNLPGASGLEVLPTLRELAPQAQIIVITQSGKESDVLRAIQFGAAGYLLKSSTASQIVDAIRTVANGGATIDSRVAKFVFNSLRSQLPQNELQDALSPRELEILKLLGDGLVKKEVAQELSISVNTVATYIRRIYEKLGVQNAPAAITKAFRLGLFPIDDD